MRTLLTDREIAVEIASATLTSGGATYLLDTESFMQPGDPGYVVGGAALPVVKDARAFGASDVLARLRFAREVGAVGVGTWLHEGQVHIDVINVIRDREQALKLARGRGEQAIWDSAAGKEIPVSAVGVAA